MLYHHSPLGGGASFEGSEAGIKATKPLVQSELCSLSVPQGALSSSLFGHC